MLDSLLTSLANVCRELLPIAGAVALIYLCILLKHAWKTVDSLTDTIKNLDPTVNLVNQSLEKAQAPLDSAVKLSHTVDEVHDKTVASFGKMADSASAGIEKIKNAVTNGGEEPVNVETTEAAASSEKE